MRRNHAGTPKKARPLGSEPNKDLLAILKQPCAIEGPIWATFDNLKKQSWIHLAIILGHLEVILLPYWPIWAKGDNLKKQSWTHLGIILGHLEVLLDHLGAHLGNKRQPKESILKAIYFVTAQACIWSQPYIRFCHFLNSVETSARVLKQLGPSRLDGKLKMASKGACEKKTLKK